MSSSTTTALSRQPLVQVLRNVADPRDRRGVRHDLPTVLSLAVTGVLAGCRSLTAIWEHTTDLTGADLRSLGVEAGQALPSESTIRRVLQDLEPADLDALLRAWLCTRTGTINGRTVIAVDGKTMRGARTGEDPAPHLLAALDHATGAVLTQERVAGKSNGACPVFCVSVLQVGVDSVGVGGGELGQGLVPVGGDLSFDELALGLALGWWQSFLLVAFSGSFVLDVADRQPQQLDHRLIGGEVAAVLGDLA